METYTKIFVIIVIIFLIYIIPLYSLYVDSKLGTYKHNQILKVMNKENRLVGIISMTYNKYITLENDLEIEVDNHTYNNIQIGDIVEVSITEQIYNGEVIETTYEIIGVIE